MKTLNAIVDRLFDYSGMFPPEGKSFEAALLDSSQFHKTLKNPRLVNSDIVLGWKFFTQVNDRILVDNGFQGRSLVINLAVLGNANDFAEIKSEISALIAFNTTPFKALNIRATSYEIKAEVPFISDPKIKELLLQAASKEIQVALEPDLSKENWKESLAEIIEYINSTNKLFSLKIRGTGPTAIGNDKIATVICAAADHKIHLKATGGMHHPIIEPDRYQNNLGFLNIVIALILRRELGNSIPESDIVSCLNVSDANEFTFDDKLQWDRYAISEDEIKLLKSKYRFTIGSCSLKEPDSDLIRLFGAKN